ncbi:MAG TPA: CHAT domain-containing protein, partial [Vicinamibacteria bacterium]|nr:CHAT domain-containing protein [Vicinamibacteria bacterium]
TVEIVRMATSNPPGAIIIGIGDLSDLSPSLLRRAFGNALVRYALRVAEDWRPGQRWQTAAFSTLLVGTGGGGAVELAECIKAITGGAVDANRHLRKNRALWDRVRIDAVEFVEMFEDRAVQAARIVRELPDLMSQELRPSEQIRPESQLDARSGGEFLHDVSPYRGGWWRRVEVRRSESATDASAQPQPQLHFTTFTDRARVEDDWVVRDEAQLTRLVKAATQQPAADLKLSNAIYEMLVPGNVKNRIAQGDNLLLVVDAQAARYPFELLAQRVGEERRPLAIGRGLLRQLAFDGRAAAPVMGPNALATGRSMLVIGAPRNVQPPLTGASREAQIVADVAEARGYQPNRCIESDSQTIQMELFAQDYRMLHVAAHGRFSPNPLASGVVIGDKEYLTVADVQSLAAVPEFVFLNACHLAKDVEPPALPFPELAAGVAVAFIRAGARAVIAAGWAVEDDAALIFAQGFYNRFLAGETFGEAVKAARQDVYAKHPDSNTWGAYQCYGNPDYRLPDPSRSSSSKHPSTPVSRSELVAMLRSLAARAGGARGQALRALAQDFSTIRDGVSARWKDGGVIAELAAVASELEDFAQASALYGDALKSAKALAPIRAVEQLVNVLGRQAPKVASDGTPEAIRAAVDLLETAKGWLDWLDKLGPSPERAALRGSLHKRWALVVAGEQRREHLRRAEAAYQDAHMRSRNESYQLLNWLALQFLNSDPADPSDLVQRTKSEWVRAMDEEQSKKEPDFWVRVAVPDALLHIRLFEGGLSNQDRAREVEEAYAAVLKMGPTARELASVTDHVVFLIKMLADLRPDRSAAARSALERVRRLLTR